MQYNVPLYMTRCVTQLRRHLSRNDVIISRHFPTPWPPRSPSLNLCDFWLWGCLKNLIYHDPITSVSQFKDNIAHLYVTFPAYTTFNSWKWDLELLDGNRLYWTSKWACFVNRRFLNFVDSCYVLCKADILK